MKLSFSEGTCRKTIEKSKVKKFVQTQIEDKDMDKIKNKVCIGTSTGIDIRYDEIHNGERLWLRYPSRMYVLVHL